MKAKRISQKAVKNMINGNTALLHIGNFDTGKRTNLKRAVSECVYTSRLYYNKDLQSDNEKIEYLVYSQPYRVFKVKLYETHIAAFNEYTEYHIDFDDTSKYYTLVNTTYFADYKGGTVSIVEVNTGNYVYTENI